MADRRGFLRQSIILASASPLSLGRPGPASAAVPPDSGEPRELALATLVAQNRERHPGRDGANHTSMALFALAALGGSEERLREFGERKLGKNLRPFPSGGPAVGSKNWRTFLGQLDALPGLRTFFRAEIGARGMDVALRVHLPTLLPSLAAEEFHCMIRTAY